MNEYADVGDIKKNQTVERRRVSTYPRAAQPKCHELGLGCAGKPSILYREGMNGAFFPGASDQHWGEGLLYKTQERKQKKSTQILS